MRIAKSVPLRTTSELLISKCPVGTLHSNKLLSSEQLAAQLEPSLQGGTIPLNTFSHVAMTYDSTSGQYVIYVNGAAVDSSVSPGQIQSTSRNVLIGREDSSLPRPFDGLIDEASLYSRALTAAEIQGIFNAGSAGKCR